MAERMAMWSIAGEMIGAGRSRKRRSDDEEEARRRRDTEATPCFAPAHSRNFLEACSVMRPTCCSFWVFGGVWKASWQGWKGGGDGAEGGGTAYPKVRKGRRCFVCAIRGLLDLPQPILPDELSLCFLDLDKRLAIDLPSRNQGAVNDAGLEPLLIELSVHSPTCPRSSPSPPRCYNAPSSPA